jgi:hypothetical protein
MIVECMGRKRKRFYLKNLFNYSKLIEDMFCSLLLKMLENYLQNISIGVFSRSLASAFSFLEL